MENLPAGKHTTPGLELQPRSTTVKDIPCDCLELIMDRLALVDHYRGWECLVKPVSLKASPFNMPWSLEEFSTYDCSPCTYVEGHMDDTLSSPEANDMDHIRSPRGLSPYRPAVRGHYCRLLLLDALMGKEQKLVLDLHPNLDGAKIPRLLPEQRWKRRTNSSRFAADKGLLVLNLHEDLQSRNGNRHDMFLVLNPINNSMSVLPPIPVPLCSCKLYGCNCKAIPLKLTVDLELEGVAQTTSSSSYKAYVLESRELPKRLRRNSRVFSCNFRVIAYNSMTKLWARTGVEWIGTRLGTISSTYTQIFPVRNGVFYLSRGRSRLYKFQEGSLVGKVNTPEIEDSYCNCNDSGQWDTEVSPWTPDYTEGHWIRAYSCGCISTTVFQSEGNIFLFQQTSMVGFFGPNCISARIWELQDRELIWRELPITPPHYFETCLKPQPEAGLVNIMGSLVFTYEGILLVVHGHRRNDFYQVAGFDVFKKTWCKVPETILDILLKRPLLPFYEGNVLDLDRFVFQPSISTRA